ncbi:hypothetical protein [Sphingobium sp. R-21]
MPQASRAFSLQDLSVHSPLYKAGGTATPVAVALNFRGASLSAWMKLR